MLCKVAPAYACAGKWHESSQPFSRQPRGLQLAAAEKATSRCLYASSTALHKPAAKAYLALKAHCTKAGSHWLGSQGQLSQGPLQGPQEGHTSMMWDLRTQSNSQHDCSPCVIIVTAIQRLRFRTRSQLGAYRFHQLPLRKPISDYSESLSVMGSCSCSTIVDTAHLQLQHKTRHCMIAAAWSARQTQLGHDDYICSMQDLHIVQQHVLLV